MKRTGQGIIEYVVMITLIVGAILLAARALLQNSVTTAVAETGDVALNVIDGFIRGNGYGG